jgi:MutS domain V
MKVLLMHPAEDFKLDRELWPESDDLVEDLGLGRVFEAMAGHDKMLLAVAKTALLSPLSHPEEIVWRQQALADCTAHPEFARQLFDLASETLESHRRQTFWGLSKLPESIRYTSVQALETLVGFLTRLRQLAEGPGQEMTSPAFVRLRTMLTRELDDSYLRLAEGCLRELKLPRGLLMSAQLGRANRGCAYMLHKVPVRGLRERFTNRAQPSLSFTVPDRDEGGLQALGELQARGINIAANALAQSVEHIIGFFTLLRTELAFYIGCLNLQKMLLARGEPLCTPVPLAINTEHPRLRAEGLYDPGLRLALAGNIIGNDVDADGKDLVVVTGANRGGKSTFLRSVGLAQLMMQSGLFVAARAFSASICPRVFTHFKRNEDPSMTGGKLDEELARMSLTVSRISPGCLLLCNEPFGSTNEKEGSDIGRQVFIPLAAAGVKVFVVTHLFDLAESLYEKGLGTALFLRAPRQAGGQPFKIVQGPPEATAYGEDVYTLIFGTPPAEPFSSPDNGLVQRSG